VLIFEHAPCSGRYPHCLRSISLLVSCSTLCDTPLSLADGFHCQKMHSQPQGASILMWQSDGCTLPAGAARDPSTALWQQLTAAVRQPGRQAEIMERSHMYNKFQIDIHCNSLLRTKRLVASRYSSFPYSCSQSSPNARQFTYDVFG
jgi:hypothetical protein